MRSRGMKLLGDVFTPTVRHFSTSNALVPFRAPVTAMVPFRQPKLSPFMQQQKKIFSRQQKFKAMQKLMLQQHRQHQEMAKMLALYKKSTRSKGTELAVIEQPSGKRKQQRSQSSSSSSHGGGGGGGGEHDSGRAKQKSSPFRKLRMGWKMALLAGATGSLTYAALNREETEEDARRMKSKTKDFAPKDSDMNKRLQRRMAKMMSGDIFPEAFDKFRQKYDTDKWAIPRPRAIETIRTAVDYTRVTGPGQMGEDVVGASKDKFWKMYQDFDITGMYRAGKTAYQTRKAIKDGGGDETHDDMLALKRNKQTALAAQLGMGMTVSAGLSFIPYVGLPLSLANTYATFAHMGHSVNELGEKIHGKRGFFYQRMEKRVKASKPPMTIEEIPTTPTHSPRKDPPPPSSAPSRMDEVD